MTISHHNWYTTSIMMTVLTLIRIWHRSLIALWAKTSQYVFIGL